MKGKFINIPKDRDPTTITLQDCKDLAKVDKIRKDEYKTTGSKPAAKGRGKSFYGKK
jgi:hypothetical protein